MEKVYHWDIS